MTPFDKKKNMSGPGPSGFNGPMGMMNQHKGNPNDTKKQKDKWRWRDTNGTEMNNI